MDETSAAWFETLEVREVYSGRSTVRIETVRMPDGSEAEREVIEHLDAVAVVPVTEAGDVLLVRQYRQPLRGYLLEIPAGVLDVEGESPSAAARREVLEEVEHEVDELLHLTTIVNSGGWTNERTHIYLGRGARPATTPSGFAAEAEEADMEVVRIPLRDAVAAVHEGELSDAKTVVGLVLGAAKLGN